MSPHAVQCGGDDASLLWMNNNAATSWYISMNRIHLWKTLRSLQYEWWMKQLCYQQNFRGRYNSQFSRSMCKLFHLSKMNRPLGLLRRRSRPKREEWIGDQTGWIKQSWRVLRIVLIGMMPHGDDGYRLESSTKIGGRSGGNHCQIFAPLVLRWGAS